MRSASYALGYAVGFYVRLCVEPSAFGFYVRLCVGASAMRWAMRWASMSGYALSHLRWAMRWAMRWASMSCRAIARAAGLGSRFVEGIVLHAVLCNLVSL